MINSDFMCYMQNIDKLRNLVRYQNAPRVSSETVAEHSYFVSAYVLKLYDYYNFDLQKALTMALLHDYSEVFISDVPHPIKKHFPMIEKELNNAEYDINKNHISKEFADWLNEFNNTSSAEGCIVALADILSVVMYSAYEIGLGNSKYMGDVLIKAEQRAITMFDVCKKYVKDGIDFEDIKTQLHNIVAYA